MKWTMITVTYTRQPKTRVYRGSISVTEVAMTKVPKDSVTETELGCEEFQALPMEEIVEKINAKLAVWPDAKITMVRPPPEESKSPRPSAAFELDEQMRDMIRDNLPEALKVFAPIHITVKVGPSVPTLPITPQ